MQRLQMQLAVAMGVVAGLAAQAIFDPAVAAQRGKAEVENYVREAMPPGFQIIVTELEGPVFATSEGKTIYRWPVGGMRNGSTGEGAGKPACYDVQYKETVGLQSPWPAGNILPRADTRPTCVQHWPPVYASNDAKSVGSWSILERTDGTRQWAYKGSALYTSHLDHRPGETNGGSLNENRREAGGAPRFPVGPRSAVPAQFEVLSKAHGRLIVAAEGKFSVYSYDKDTSTKSNCIGECLDDWKPILAPDSAVPQDEWSTITRPGGTKQWAFRGKPLYLHIDDSKGASYEGGDVPGWHNVFTQRSPNFPAGFKVVDTNAGQVIVDSHGKTIYFYNCGEDTPDTLFCDSPGSPPEYRWAVCGGGDPERCLRTFPYVSADKGAKSNSLAWSIIDVEPKTGALAAPGMESVHVWAFRGRPIYTFAQDTFPGDLGGDSFGQDHGAFNGFEAFWVRDVYGRLD